MSIFDKAIGYEFGQSEADKKIRKVERENVRMNNYYHNALNQRDQEIINLKHRISQLLTAQETNKKAYNKLKEGYSNYREESLKLVEKEYNNIYDAYRTEQQKNLLLEEKIKVLEATIEHLKSE